MSINIPQARAELYAARNSQADLCEWAQKYGAKLLAELERITHNERHLVAEPTCELCREQMKEGY